MTVIDVKIAAGIDDGYFGTASAFDNSATTINLSSGTTQDRNFYWWDNITIPDGATINTAHILCYFRDAETTNQIDLYFEDAADPAVVSGFIDGNTRAFTTASVAYVIDGNTPNSYFQSPSIISIINELMGSYSYASGAAMQMLFQGDSSSNALRIRSYDQSESVSANLYIDYTAGGGGGRTTFNTDTYNLGLHTGMAWRINQP